MKLIRLTQGGPQWLAWRQDGIGGSDAAAILGVSPFPEATRENLLREKVTRTERETNFAMRRGQLMEPGGWAIYEHQRRCIALPACVEHDQKPWMRVSLDGLCKHRAFGPDDRPWILELKCPNEMAHSWALAGEVPPYYLPQCQWQLLTTGLPFLHYASWSTHSRYGPALQPGQLLSPAEAVEDALRFPDRFATVLVDHDAEMQARLLEECERFWGEVVEGRKRREVLAGAARLGGKVEAEFA